STSRRRPPGPLAPRAARSSRRSSPARPPASPGPCSTTTESSRREGGARRRELHEALRESNGVRSPLATSLREDGKDSCLSSAGPAISEYLTLNLDLRSQLDHAVRRESKERHRARGVAGHEREELLAPDRHAERSVRNQRLASQEEGRVHEIEFAPAELSVLERPRHVRILHEAVTQSDPVEALFQGLDLHPFAARDEGHGLGLNRQKHDALVHGLIVSEVLEKRRRSSGADAVHEDRSARHAE